MHFLQRTQAYNSTKLEVETETHKHIRRIQAEQVLGVLQGTTDALKVATREARDAKHTFDTWKDDNEDAYDEGDPEYTNADAKYTRKARRLHVLQRQREGKSSRIHLANACMRIV